MTTPYGLQIVNPSGNLVLTTEAFGLYYAGKATYAGTAPAFHYGVGEGLTEDTYGIGSAYAFYRQYTFVSSLPAAFAVPIYSSGRTGIVNVSKSGSTYTITAVFSSGAPVSGIYPQSNLDIYCFTRPTSHGPFGLGLYDASGVLAYDLSGSQKPLFVQAQVNFAAGVYTATMPTGFTQPAVLNCCAYINDALASFVGPPAGRYRLDGAVGCYGIYGGNLTRLLDFYRNGPTFNFGAGMPPAFQYGPAVSVYLIEASSF